MKCARFKLQKRPKTSQKLRQVETSVKPRHYCQQRMVDPGHEEDPRWIDVLERFHCHASFDSDHADNSGINQGFALPQDDLYLTVQNLKFLGNVQKRMTPRTSFKYKNLVDGRKHRMFVKQAVDVAGPADDDQESQLSSYYLDDFAKYLIHPDRSRPSSGRSTAQSPKFKENKAVQTDATKITGNRKTRKQHQKPAYEVQNNDPPENNRDAGIADSIVSTETKVAYHRSGKRKSITLSRAHSPETVQVIRVDVVCNNFSTSSPKASDSEEQNKTKCDGSKQFQQPQNNNNVNIRDCYYANKYLLTNTYKTLDENISGGTKVTLLCKTFRLSDRSRLLGTKKQDTVKKNC